MTSQSFSSNVRYPNSGGALNKYTILRTTPITVKMPGTSHAERNFSGNGSLILERTMTPSTARIRYNTYGSSKNHFPSK